MPGEVLFRQGSWGERIYVVEQGEIEIVSERADGTEELKTVVTAGGYFGEMGPAVRRAPFGDGPGPYPSSA